MAKKTRPNRLQVIIRWRFREFIDSWTLDWDTFVKFLEQWRRVKSEAAPKDENWMRIEYEWMNTFTSQNVDLRDIDSISPSPEDYE